jgi:hypothetical protein
MVWVWEGIAVNTLGSAAGRRVSRGNQPEGFRGESSGRITWEEHGSRLLRSPFPDLSKPLSLARSSASGVTKVKPARVNDRN